jgi:hypothetical protein
VRKIKKNGKSFLPKTSREVAMGERRKLPVRRGKGRGGEEKEALKVLT